MVAIALRWAGLAATSASSHSAENTLASGVRAPPFRLGSERFNEPHETKHENSPPARFDRPWPTNSWLTSI